MKRQFITTKSYGLSKIFSVSFLLVLLFSISNFAQNVQNQENTVDKSFKTDLKVDPITLGMSFNLPLGGYAGRGGTSVPVIVSNNSKVWKMEYEGYYQGGACCAPSFTANPQGLPTEDNYSWVAANFGEDTAAGWRVSSFMPEVLGEPLGLYDYNGDPGSMENPNVDFYVDRIRLRMPDGATHEFRKDDRTYTLPYRDNYPTTYYSVDGSKMKYVKESETAAVLYLPDGSRYVWGENWGYYDRHGNKIGETDTLGRTINIPSLANYQTGDQTHAMLGINNTSRNYVLRWRYLKNTQTGESVLSNPNQPLRYTGDANSTGSYPDPNITPTLFQSGGGTRVIPATVFNPIVLAEVELPNGSKYKFRYNIYGEIDKIIYPTGSYERFEYGEILNIDPLNEPYTQTNRGVKKRWVSENGTGSDEILTEYAVISTTPYTVRTTNADGTRTERVIKKGRGPGVLKYGFDDASAGSIIEERFYNSGNQMLRRTLNSYITEGARGTNPEPTAMRDSRLEKQISIIIEPNSSDALMTQSANKYDSHTDLEYFAYLNVKRVKEYGFTTVSKTTAENTNNDFGTFAAYFNSQTPTRITETDYLYDANYKARNMTSLPIETRILDGQNNVRAKTQVIYDESGYALASTGTMPTNAANSWIDPLTELGTTIGSKRGLVTTVRSYTDVANNQYIQTHSFYDQYGNVRKVRDGRNIESFTEYDDDYAFAYPTKTISAVPDQYGTYGSSAALTSEMTYDFNSGLPLTSKDANNQISTIEYNDVLLRPTKVIAPNGHQTITEYGVPDSNGQLIATQRFVKVRTQIDETNWKQGYTWFDGLGRTIKTQSIDSNGDVFTETEYDNMSRVKKVSNPYRTGETIYKTESFYDDLSRVWKVKTPDNAEILTTYDLATTGANIGTVVVVKDQALKERRSITNALGQLERVDEPNDSNQLGAINSPNQPTNYSYDTLNNLLTVTQGAQTRSFVYDSLSRLKTATNPESGAINYQYDNNGNLTSKTNARGVVTNYVYDNLNRVTNRNYSAPQNLPNYQATPNVSYFYDDVNVAFSKGKLTKVSSAVSETKYTQFDNVGRILASQQITDGQTYTSGYVYNLSGALIEETYPSGRVVKNTLDADGDLQQVQSKKVNDTFKNYANSFNYTAAGAVSSMRLGNGRWENMQFNSRLQPVQIGLGMSAANQGLLKLDYEYGATATQNNGNIIKQTITVPTVGSNTGFTAIQTYNYDSLNRIKDATENLTPHGGSSTQTWKQTFQYDRYGNRRFDQANTTFPTSFSNPNITNPNIDTSNNRFTTGQGYTYDLSGNLITDAEGRSFFYDAENKQKEAKNASNQTLGQYFYDGDGKRIKKYVPSTGEITIFVYDADGKMVAEYSTIVEPQATAKISYLTNDHLGSPRIITDQNGAVVSRRDFLPFGEEIQRTNYGNDNVREKFATYECDIEIDLDFAQARYYNSRQGRFTSVDPLLASASTINPQSFNRYIYVLNNPLTLIDRTGAFPEFTFSLYVRAFAPYHWFGPLNIAMGDGRGFSTNPNASYRVQAYTEVTATNDGRLFLTSRTEASEPALSVTNLGNAGVDYNGIPIIWSAQSECYINGSVGLNDSVNFHIYGNDDAIPLVSSDIDLHTGLGFSYVDQGNGIVDMTVTGAITGDQFPAAEAFIRDNNGNSVMLGVFAPTASSGPVLSLPFDGTLPMIDVNVTVRVNNGIFQGVVENGNIVPLEEYNNRFLNQPAVRPNE